MVHWPETMPRIRQEIVRQWGVHGDIHLLREFSDGYSAARVFDVDLTGSLYQGRAVLKLEPTNARSSEAGRLGRASLANLHFARQHIPKLLGECTDGDVSATLSALAGDVSAVHPTFELRAPQQLVALQRVSSELLAVWNKGCRFGASLCSPEQTLRNWLQHRLEPGDGNRIHSFLKKGCSLEPSATSFSFRGEWFPNPYCYAREAKCWPANTSPLVLAYGHCHGDLHERNILARLGWRGALDYFLIDFASYEDDAPLLFDHAYLELSRLLRARQGSSTGAWLELLGAVAGEIPVPRLAVSEETIEPDDQGLVRLVGTVRESIDGWIEKCHSGRRDHLESQAVLARVAAGLNFVNKARVSDDTRRKAFLYAAAQLKSYLAHAELRWEADGPVTHLGDGEPIIPSSNAWREAWTACGHFARDRAAYVLIAGPDARAVASTVAAAFGAIPWAMVVDFDSGTRAGGLLEAVRPLLAQHRAVRELLPENVNGANFEESTCWIFASGINERPDTVPEDVRDWRHGTLPAIQRCASALHRAVSPKRIIVLVAEAGIADTHLRPLLETLDVVFGKDTRVVHVTEGSAKGLDESFVTLVSCSLVDFAAGLSSMMTGIPPTPEVRLPRRPQDGSAGTSVLLTVDQRQYIREDLEVVHTGLGQEPPGAREIAHDFWHGYEVSWPELNSDADVRREVTEPLKANLVRALERTRTLTVTLQHSPGAGGTTVARRIAWDLRQQYPTVIVRRVSQHTVSRLATLVHLTQLPVLAVIEAADVSPQARDALFRDLRAQNVRAVLLYVVRSMNPKSDVSVVDPMDAAEAQRFLARYQGLTPSLDRQTRLRQLTEDPELVDYRSPFFFGLYAFDDEFVRVGTYVSQHLKDASVECQRVLRLLALMTRFSQRSMPDALIRKLARLDDSTPLVISDLLGEGPARLIQHRSGQARVVHPHIAKEMLMQLQPGTLGASSWGSVLLELADLSCEFIDVLVDAGGPDAEVVLEIFGHMFISREPWDLTIENRPPFSELISSIRNPLDASRVLLRLTERCPDEAHFWNHLGRYTIYELERPYKDAESHLKRAVELQPENDVHHHTLGMVYRFEVQRRLAEAARKYARADEAIEELKWLIDAAEECFVRARLLEPESEHGAITNIQLLTSVIRRLFQLSGVRTYAEMLRRRGPATDWCLANLPRAEELLRDARNLRPGDPSKHTVRCMNDVHGLYGDFDSLIHSLTMMLAKGTVDRPSARRIIARARVQRHHGKWRTLQDHPKELGAIRSLMDKNLAEVPSSAKDLWLWFQAARRLPDFDIAEATRRYHNWVLREDAVEAWYYLYVLNFIQFRQGAISEHGRVVEEIRRCKELAGGASRTRSFEWLASSPAWCPLLHASELGAWDDTTRFFENTEQLARVSGSIRQIKSPQSGVIAVGPFDAFFVPGVEFHPGGDENRPVSFYLGFSHEGLRAWSVEHG